MSKGYKFKQGQSVKLAQHLFSLPAGTVGKVVQRFSTLGIRHYEVRFKQHNSIMGAAEEYFQPVNLLDMLIGECLAGDE